MFGKQDVEFVRTAVTRQDRRQAATDVVGHKAKRNMPAQQIIRSGDVDLSSLAENAILIKPRDVVRMIARKRGLTVVVPAGEALQQGRLGEMIRVRNPQSRKIVIGRVLSSGEVEVPL